MDNNNVDLQQVINEYKDNVYYKNILPKSDKKYATSYTISVIEDIIYQKRLCAGIANYDNTGWFNSLFQFILCMSNFVYSILNITETLGDNVHNLNTNPKDKHNPYKINITESQHIMKHIFRKQLLIYTEYSSGVLTKEDIHTCFEVLNFNCEKTDVITEYNKQQEVANKLNKMLNIFNAKEDDNYIYNTDCFIFKSAPRQLLDKTRITSYSNILTVLIEPQNINDTISELITKSLTKAKQNISKLSTYLIIELRLTNTDIANVKAIQIQNIRKVDHLLKLEDGLQYYLSGFICYINEATSGKKDYIFYKIISVNDDDVDFNYICYDNDIIYNTQQFNIGGNNITIPIIDTYKLTYDKDKKIITIENKNIRPNILLYTQNIIIEKKQRDYYITKVKDEADKQTILTYKKNISNSDLYIHTNQLYNYTELDNIKLAKITKILNDKTNPRRGINNNGSACFFNAMLQFVLYIPEFVLSILKMDRKEIQNDLNIKNLIRNILLKHLLQQSPYLSLSIDESWTVILQLFKKDILKDEKTNKDILPKQILYAQQDSAEALEYVLNKFPDKTCFSFNEIKNIALDKTQCVINLENHITSNIIFHVSSKDITNKLSLADIVIKKNTEEFNIDNYYTISKLIILDNKETIQQELNNLTYTTNEKTPNFEYKYIALDDALFKSLNSNTSITFIEEDTRYKNIITEIRLQNKSLFLKCTKDTVKNVYTYKIVIYTEQITKYNNFNKYIIFHLKLFSISKEKGVSKILKQEPLKYNLIIGQTPYILSGFIVHIGSSPNSGHYIFYKMTSKNTYIVYNDITVCTNAEMDTTCEAFPHLKLHFSNDYNNTYISIIKQENEKEKATGENTLTPYILLYEKHTPQKKSNNITNNNIKNNNNNNTRNNFSFNLTFNDILGLS